MTLIVAVIEIFTIKERSVEKDQPAPAPISTPADQIERDVDAWMVRAAEEEDQHSYGAPDERIERLLESER